MSKQLHFGFWTVLDPLPVQRRVLCRCACGVERRVYLPSLTRGKSRSCHRCASKRMHATGSWATRQPRRSGRWWSESYQREEDQWIRDADGRVVRRASP